jgi:hypothetical protein
MSMDLWGQRRRLCSRYNSLSSSPDTVHTKGLSPRRSPPRHSPSVTRPPKLPEASVCTSRGKWSELTAGMSKNATPLTQSP